MSGPDEETLEEIRRTARELLAKELAPRLEATEAAGEFCLEAYRALGEHDLLAPMFPEPWGTGCLFTQAVIAEEMARVSSGFALSAMASVGLFGANVAHLGTPEQKETYLPGIASGERTGCWALTEPGVGSDAVSITTRCERRGDGWVLNGSKTFITNAPIADWFIVLAREEGRGFEGATAFLMERGDPGLETGAPLEKMGHWSSPTGEIFLNDAELPASRVLGAPGKAFRDMKRSLDLERGMFCALALGIMEFCLKTSIEFGATRKQFGVPILEHQLVQEKIAEMAGSISILRTYQDSILGKLTDGVPVTKEAAIIKLFGSRWLMQTTNDAVQCLGGYGYMKEYGVERCMRDARLFEIGGGTSEIQKLIIAKQTVREHTS